MSVKTKKIIPCLALGLGTALLTGTTYGSTVTATFHAVTAYSGVTINYRDPNAGNAAKSEATVAGLFQWIRRHDSSSPLPADNDYTGNGIPSASAATRFFYTMCIEVNQNIYYNGTYNYAEGGLETAESGGGISLVGQRATDITKLWGQYYNSTAPLSMTADQAAGLQLAIWEVVYDNGSSSYTTNANKYSIVNGGLTVGHNISFTNVSASAITIAQSYLDNLPNLTPNTTSVGALTNPTYQDQSFLINGQDALVVPVPSAAWMGLLTLPIMGATVAIRRYRTQQV